MNRSKNVAFRHQVEALEDRCLPAPVVMDHFQLGAGDAVFWDGPYVENARAEPEGCELGVQGPCWAYEIEVLEPADQLRVAFDHPDLANSYVVELLAPGAAHFGRENQQLAQGQNSVEFLVENPPLGTWTAHVSPVDVVDSAFRMRAKLEATPTSAPQAELLFPNLRILAPWEFQLVAPVNQVPILNGSILTHGPAPIDVAGVQPFSCCVDEMAEGSERCLRFSFGTENAGPGQFEVYFDRPMEEQLADDPTRKTFELKQRVYYSDYADNPTHYVEFSDGDVAAEVHPIHGHFHVEDIVAFDLFKVANRRPSSSCDDKPRKARLVPAGEGAKIGMQFLNMKIAEWHIFDQQPQNTTADPDFTSGQPVGGLSGGWTDVYRWHTADNYVEFGDNADGLYLVQVRVDPENVFQESNEKDNVSYAYIQVKDGGNTVVLLHRGYGSSPWDPHRVVPDDFYNPPPEACSAGMSSAPRSDAQSASALMSLDSDGALTSTTPDVASTDLNSVADLNAATLDTLFAQPEGDASLVISSSEEDSVLEDPLAVDLLAV